MSDFVTPIAVRNNLTYLARRHGITLSELSRSIGRRPNHLSQFIQAGSPKMLPENLRLAIAMSLNVDERLLGARDPWSPTRDSKPNRHQIDDTSSAVQHGDAD